MVASPTQPMTSYPWNGCGQGHVTHFRILQPLKYLWKLETSNVVNELATWSISLVMTDYPPSGRGQGHMTHIYILGPRLYVLEQMKIVTSDLVCKLHISSITIYMLK